MEKKRILASLCFGTSLFCFTSVLAHFASYQPPNPPLLQSLQGHEQVLQYGGLEAEVLDLARQLPQGWVVAMDVPHDASNVELSNITFRTDYFEKNNAEAYDYVLACETLARHNRQQTLLSLLSSRLKPQGKMRLHLPDYHRGPVAQALRETWIDLQEIALPSPKYLIYSLRQYQKMMEKTGIRVEGAFNSQRRETFQNLEQFKTWLKDSWPYYKAVASQDQVLFLNTFIENYLAASSQSKHGPIIWDQGYLDVEGRKLIV